MEEQKGPFCQSCGMPLEKPEDFGTDEKGFRINDYCHFCFKDGEFTNPVITLEEMIRLATDCMVKYVNIPEEQARQITTEHIPTLKRWQNK